jgi:hypothetical protein
MSIREARRVDMRRYWFLPALAAAGFLAAGSRVCGQQPDSFGSARTNSAGALPSGIEPVRSSAATRPANPFPLTADAGPWMICAAHFMEIEGADLARQLVQVIRNEHRMKAFIYNRGDEERRQQDEEWERYRAQFPPGTPLRRKTVRIQDQWAVLVGGFPDFNAASAVLPQVKGWKPPLQLKRSDGRCPFDAMSYQEYDPKTRQMETKRQYVNPFQSAMVVRNPLVSTAATKKNWDPSWERFNAGEDYSLLENRGAYTLMVKKYSGGGVILGGSTDNGKGKGFLGAIGLGSSDEDRLGAAGRQAHELAKFLRNPRLGFDAYVLHTKNSSIVTVGAFKSPDDPGIQRLQQQLTNLRFTAQKGNTSDPIALMAAPVLVQVPKP